jgi:hypothetical protein
MYLTIVKIKWLSRKELLQSEKPGCKPWLCTLTRLCDLGKVK